MNTYHIRYRASADRRSGLQTVRADTVSGFKSDQDCYVFMRQRVVVAVVSKDIVASIEKRNDDEPVEQPDVLDLNQ